MPPTELGEGDAGAIPSALTRTQPGSAWLVTAVILVALNLRPLFTSVGAVLEAVRLELVLSSAQVGVLTTLPAWCMGAVALVGGGVIGSLGTGWGMRWALLVLAFGSFIRVFADSLAVLAFASFLGGVGIAVAQVLTPVVIKARFPRRAATVMAGYTAFMNLGASLGAAVTPWLAAGLDGWRPALGLWCLPAVAALALWPGHLRVGDPSGRRSTAIPWCNPMGWRIAAFLVASSGTYVSLLSWTAPVYQALGWSEAQSGLLLAGFTAAQVIGAFLVLPLTLFSDDRRPGLVVTLSILGLGLAGMLWQPQAAPWLWMVLMGVGLGAAFPLALVLPLDYADTPEEAGGLTAMGFGLGLILGGLGPWMVGLLRDHFGGFTVALSALLVLVGVKILIATTFRPRTPSPAQRA